MTIESRIKKLAIKSSDPIWIEETMFLNDIDMISLICDFVENEKQELIKELEKLKCDAETTEDVAYNKAIYHCVDRINHLKQK